MLRKIAAILLLFLFWFNLIGYRVLFQYMEWRSNISMENKLNKVNYNEVDLVTFKISTTLPPYVEKTNTFQSIQGKVMVKGIQYNYVKMRFYHDTLEVKCLPNEQMVKVLNAKEEFANLANDLVFQSNEKTTHSTSTKNFSVKKGVGDYDNYSTNFKIDLFHRILFHYSYEINEKIICPNIRVPDEPPQIA